MEIYFDLFSSSNFSFNVKGIVTRDEYFLKTYNNNTFGTRVDSFYNFLFLSDEKIKLAVLACSDEIAY
jgi:hypothetical protein